MPLPHPKGPIIDLGLSHDIIPSGVHVGVPSHYLSPIIPEGLSEFVKQLSDGPITIEICNPMPRTLTAATQLDEVKAADADKYLFNGNRTQDKLVRLQDITEYGELLKRAAELLRRFPCDGLIVPLRGGIKPFTQLEALTEFAYTPCWLPFTQGANGLDHDLIRALLRHYLEPRTEGASTRLIVIDTADSGHSSYALANILKELQVELSGSSKWRVDFVLFFESEGGKKTCPPRSRLVPTLNSDHISFRVYACGTTSLIAEDWDEALGVKATWDSAGRPHIAVIPSKGRIVVQGYDGSLKEYEVERLDQFVDALLANEVSDAVTTDNQLTFKREVWHNYHGKHT